MLPQPTTAAGRAGLAAILAEPARALVAVDYDGTLAPIVARPQDAVPAPGAVPALTALAARIGSCVVVTGRAAVDAVELGGLAELPGLMVLGHYGLERWQAGDLDSPAPVPAVEKARRRLQELLRAAPAGVHLEDKRHSLVVHTRPASDPAAALAALTPRLLDLAAELGLEAVPGRMVLELRPPGIDKGSALRGIVTDRRPAAVLYAGDDLGDLPAYAAVEELRSQGIAGLTVASADPAQDDAPAELAARADLVLPGPRGVVRFLEALATVLATP